MYVQCERCKTEYEFDDALVSERGTTVKCTSCAHQFRIRKVGTAADDRWPVKTAAGEEKVFTSLKDLQRAILGGSLSRDDVLHRAGLAPRALGAIAELETFFRPLSERKLPSVKPSSSERTSGSIPYEKAIGKEGEEEKAARAFGQQVTVEVARPNATTLRPNMGMPDPASPTRAVMHAPLAPTVPAMFNPTMEPTLNADPRPAVPPPANEIKATRLGVAPPPASATQASIKDARQESVEPASVEAAVVSSPAFEVPRTVVVEDAPARIVEAPPRVPHISYPSEDAMLSSGQVPKKAGGRWIPWVIILAGGAGLAAIFLPTLRRSTGASSDAPSASGSAQASSPGADPRVADLVARGEAALSEGDLDVADESFTKASALTERDPRVAYGMARTFVLRADTSWLELRVASLLDRPEADLSVMRRRIEEEGKRALRLSETAKSVLGPSDPKAIALLADAQRINGDLDAARKLTAGAASDTGLSYSLAMLDLTESKPSSWASSAGRLRSALATEPRARPALIFALVRAGDLKNAEAELDLLAKEPHPHPLLPILRAIAAKRAEPDAGVVDAGPPLITPSLAASLATANSNGSAAPGVEAISNDPRKTMIAADTARHKGDLKNARRLYEAVLSHNPNESEALTGLGDVFHEQRDVSNARVYYTRALSSNPRFLPAKLGMADLLWETGEKPNAIKAYKEIVDVHSVGAYPPYVRTRAESSP